MTVMERPRRWTRAEYYRMGDMGFFEDERVELLDGEIWALPPQTPSHSSAAEAAADALQAAFGIGSVVRRRGPLTLGSDTEPEPDIAVAAGSHSDYEDHHPAPSEVRLLVEVSDATLAKDRGRKAEDYAQAGIPDYWIINIISRQLEVHRDPGSLPSGHGYKLRRVLLEGESIAPLLAPDRLVSVTDLLPLLLPPRVAGQP